ncbi:nitrous oxide reductase family maturation protein NosD [Mesobacillus maritimus]|uniref:right-handed parallel beta-helix repeat-containing protein n=1 Tax=Mesobacillus maritimus TaxID=1643336 RepID=UPI00384F421C
MKLHISVLLLLLFLMSIPSLSEASTSSLQAKINEAPEGSIVEIQAGEYEGPLVISKPITIVGNEEVLLRSCDAEPVVAISGVGVTLKNLQIEHCGAEKEETAISITGSQHVLQGIKIDTRRFGIKLEDANEVIIRDSEIVGRKQGNGIDLWKSNRNQLENVKISSVSDGFYLEQSNENLILKNTIENSRYGMHLMYSNDNALRHNLSSSNVTGAMLMETERTSVDGNAFYANKKSVNAQGLLLYEAYETDVIENEFFSNRIGVYIEKAANNQVESNKIMDNFIGVQMKNANDNEISKNTFIGNVNEAQAIESANNDVNHNYWDAASKVDINVDGASEISFTADPYFLTLANYVPEYQLFFQAPGLILLQNLLKSPPDQLLTDSSPFMEMTIDVEKETSSHAGLWTISIMMIVVSSSVFILGRKRI